MSKQQNKALFKGESLWSDALRRLLKNKMAVVGGIIVIIFAFLAIFADVIAPYPYEEQIIEEKDQAPSLKHLCGTDNLGRDMFSRILYGGRISLTIGIAATMVSVVIGVIYGAIAGYVGGKLDNAMMRLVDVLYTLPFILFIIILMVLFGRNIFLIFVALGFTEWYTMARIIRGQVLSVKHKEFIEAAVVSGLSRRKIIVKHIIPNVLGPLIAYSTLTVPALILAEAFLSFLGLGVQAPMTSWGALVSDGSKLSNLMHHPWQVFFPGIILALCLFSFNFLGDGLNDALDPRQKGKS